MATPNNRISKYDKEFSVYLVNRQIFSFPSELNKILSTNDTRIVNTIRKVLKKYSHMYNVCVSVEDRRYNGLFSTWYTNSFDKKFINTIRSQVNNEIRNGKRN